MSKYEIIYIPDHSVVGIATKLEDGYYSIELNGNFAGVYRTFEEWRPTPDYRLSSLNKEPPTRLSVSWFNYATKTIQNDEDYYDDGD
jgi:hypothetical protein